MMQFFLPSVILSIFILCSHFVKDEYDADGNVVESNYADMLATVSLSMLTLIEIYQSIRDAIPETLEVTMIEMTTIIYIIYCLFPIVDARAFKNYFASVYGVIVWLVINFIIITVMMVKFFM